MIRDDFTEKTKETLAKRVGYQCSNPHCPKPETIGPGEAEDSTINLGVAAHIYAAAPGGPRYEEHMESAERKHISNGIWLCQRCAKLIDSDQGKGHPAELLRDWKRRAEQRTHHELTGTDRAAAFDSSAMTEIEAVLERYCEDRVSEWEEARNDPADPDRLMHYIEPHYSLLRAGLQPIDASRLSSPASEWQRREDPYTPVIERHSKQDDWDDDMWDDDDGEEDDSEEDDWEDADSEPTDEPQEGEYPEGQDDQQWLDELLALLRVSRRLCLTEDAGAGKSVATRRIQAFLCSSEGQQQMFDGRPVLVVRWEQRVQRWPESFDRQGLIRALAAAVEPSVRALGAKVSAIEVAEWALSNGRVFLILDALDQVTDKQAVQSLEESLHSGPMKDGAVLLTSRAHAVNAHAALFQDTRGWRFARIDGFDEHQQEQYFKDLPGGGLYAMFPNYEEVMDLLRVPVVLGLVRRLAEGDGVARFRTRGELYLQVHEDLLRRAAGKRGQQPDSDQQVRWAEILAATACEMMIRGMYDYSVHGSFAVGDIHRGASQRCEQPITAEEWRIIESVSDLTDRCILDGATGRNLCWKHRGMMEFYCGLHLARNSQPGWVVPASDRGGVESVRCGDAGVRHMAREPEWEWAWRFAIEMSPVVWWSDSRVLLASVAELFERPERLEPSEPRARPNELIYRVWPLLEGSRADGVRLPQGERVIARFQAEFQELVEAKNATAVELRNSFVRCPPAELGIDRQPFQMGSSDADQAARPNERPQHPVVLSPFSLQMTPVTRAQYRLYDPQHETVFADWFSELDAFAKWAPEDACPMILVSWYDAWVFARWAGGRLPTEAEWEYACRAGTQTRYSFGNKEGALDEYAWYASNSGGQTHPVGQRKPNGWGLYDMHGNVYEWCQDWLDDEYYSKSPIENPAGGEEAGGRVIRGGCWRFGSRLCRSAGRIAFEPSVRLGYLGFRVAAVPFGPVQSGSARAGRALSRAEPGA